MFKIDVMYDVDSADAGVQADKSVRREKHIYPFLCQCFAQTDLEPPPPEQRMSGLRVQDNRRHIFSEYELLLVRTVKKEDKLMFRMVFDKTADNLIGIPCYAVHFPLDE